MHLTVEFDGGVMNLLESFHETPEQKTGGQSISNIKEDVENLKTEATANSDFANAINSALGLYYSKQTMSDGSLKIYGHDKPTLAESTYVFTSTSAGFAWTAGENCWNGGSPEWQHGIDRDGNAILHYLIADKIFADIIQTKKIVSEDGKTYFDVENSEISIQNGKIGGWALSDKKLESNQVALMTEFVPEISLEQYKENYAQDQGFSSWQEYYDSLSLVQKLTINSSVQLSWLVSYKNLPFLTLKIGDEETFKIAFDGMITGKGITYNETFSDEEITLSDGVTSVTENTNSNFCSMQYLKKV